MKRLTRRCKQALNDKMTRIKKFIEIALSEPKYHEKGNFSTQSTYDIYETNRLYPMADKLASYEDAEEQGLLLWLPCKEGTEVFCIASCEETCDDADSVLGCLGNCKHKIVIPMTFDRDMVEQFGKTVFLTREEAEKALADMGV